MNKPQAKEFLRLYRPGMRDEHDPDMAASLGKAAEDPELREWQAQQEEFNRALREKLQRIRAPEGLKERILRNRPPPRVTIWWRQPEILAMAAGFVLLICLAAFWIKPKEENLLAGFRLRMAKYALTRYRMDIATNDMRQIRTYLNEKGGFGDFISNRELDRLPGAGCALLRWQNQPVSLVCYQLDANNLMWLFMVDQAALSDPPDSLKLEPVGKLMTASWSRQGKTYLLAAIGEQTLILKYLQ